MGKVSIGKGKLGPGPYDFHVPKGTQKHGIVPVLHIPDGVAGEQAQRRNLPLPLLNVGSEQLQGIASSQQHPAGLHILPQHTGMGQEPPDGQLLMGLRHGAQIDEVHRLLCKPGRLQVPGAHKLRLRHRGGPDTECCHCRHTGCTAPGNQHLNFHNPLPFPPECGTSPDPGFCVPGRWR